MAMGVCLRVPQHTSVNRGPRGTRGPRRPSMIIIEEEEREQKSRLSVQQRVFVFEFPTLV
jgi:hypothetical protein